MKEDKLSFITEDNEGSDIDESNEDKEKNSDDESDQQKNSIYDRIEASRRAFQEKVKLA